MAKIKVNLLGKKKAEVPFGLDETFNKLGINVDDIASLRPALIKIAVAAIGIYAADYVPNYFYQEKLMELDQKIAALTQRKESLSAELTAKKEIRNQKSQLDKEEIELQRQLNAVNALKLDRGLAFRTLDSLMSTLPKTVWLSSIRYSARKMVLNGSSWDYFSINDFVKSINESTQYASVGFKGIQTKAASEPYPGVPESMKKIKTFDLEYAVKGAGDSM